MKKILFLTALLLAHNVEASEQFFVVNCGRDVVYVAISAFPQGLPFSNWEICSCLQRGWKGLECSRDIKNRELAEEIERKNLNLINIILGE